jgi:2-dehydro-3-deoxy-D-arabinonate dehydratase
MRLGQIRFENKLTAALFEEGGARPVPGYSLVELIRKGVTEGPAVALLAERMASRHPESTAPGIPICPVEVWGCGCAGERDRPPIFFKGTARICVGPAQPIGIRFDSKFTAPVPALAVVLGPNGAPLGYTLANDVTARDLEAGSPCCLPQAKTFTASCALGPVIVSVDEIASLGALRLSCTIRRGGEEVFSQSVALGAMEQRLPVILDHLMRANKVPAGSALLAEIGIRVPESAALAPGDTVHIAIPEIGELVNPAMIVR